MGGPAGSPRDDGAHLARHRHADRVREHDLVRAGVDEARGERQHARRVDGALERAAERGAERDGGAQVVLVRAGDDPLARGDRVLRAGTRVAPVELVADREREVHLVERGLAQPLVAALVERQARVGDALAPLDPRHHLLGARHLRHSTGMDEAHGLDARHAGAGEPVDELGSRDGVEHGASFWSPSRARRRRP